MATILQLKKRIKSVTNISKITKAMEMVAASKMRQAQLQALSSRHYSRKLEDILSKIASRIDTTYHPLLSSHTLNSQEALLIVSTDRGLTGSLNANLFKSINIFQQDHQAHVYTVGRLAKEYAIKSNFDLVAEFGEVGEVVSYEITQPVAGLLMKEFLDGRYQKVYIAYMDFISTLEQNPRIIQLLPLSKQSSEEEKHIPGVYSKEYIFEPDAQSLLNSLLPYSVEMSVYQSLLEARASEHSARMVAMKNASENASELKDNLSLQFNRSRQAKITSELSDIVTATMSLGS